MNIKILIKDKVATVEGAPCIVCGNSDYNVVFTFDEAWEAYDVKTARFVYTSKGAQRYMDVIFEGNSCAVPILSGVSEVFVGVYAGNLVTTTPACICCKQSILCGDPVHTDPPADVYTQLLALLMDRKGRAGRASLAPTAVQGSVGQAQTTTLEEGETDGTN